MVLTVVAAIQLHAKDGQTYYTTERVVVGRENVAKYEWAKQTLKTILAGEPHTYYVGREYFSARDCAQQTDDVIWTLQPTTRIPRVYPHEARALCPIHGEEVKKISAWSPWRIDPIKHPYKVQCLLSKEWYPSNDYLAGDMTSGEFADDGNGFEYKGKRYYFLRAYAHHAYGSVTIPALRALSQAWLLTGDRVYAHKCAVLLARLASEYPNFADRKDRLFYATTGGSDPHYGGKTGGMITDLIWETFCLEAAAYAYDGICDFIGRDDELVTFLQKKGLPVKNAADVRRYIEENLLRVGMQALRNGHIKGNEGHHQAAAMACALVMDDYGDRHPNSADMVDYTYHGAGHAAWMLVNGLTRDGGGHESPNYNYIKLDFIRVSRLMEEIRRRQPGRFPRERYPDLFAEPKSRAIFDHCIGIQLLDVFLPSIGDCGGIGPISRTESRQHSFLTHENVFAFTKYGDARFALAAKRIGGDFFKGELFEPFPQEAMTKAIASPGARIERRSQLLDGYGIGILRSGSGDAARAVTLNYTSLEGHRQHDNLMLELYAYGLRLLPDLGYPVTWDHRWQWDSNSMAHNTVTVDECQPSFGIGGAARLMAEADGVHVVSVRHVPYPFHEKYAPNFPRGVDLYERTVVLVDVGQTGVSGPHFYVVDLFTVRGGSQHDQSWHGPMEPLTAPALDWKEQQTGTLAGPDVPQFGKWTDRWGRKRDDFPSYLTGIRRATLREPAAWHWDLKLDKGDALRLHIVPVGGAMEIIQGRGRSPARPKNWALNYIIARRLPKDRETSRFLSVLEPCQGKPVIQSVALKSQQPLVLKIERDNGSDEIELRSTTAQQPLGVRVSTVGMWEGPQRPDCESGANGRGAEAPSTFRKRDVRIGFDYHTSTIRAVDYPNNAVAVGRNAAFAVGRHIRIHNAHCTAMFRIEKVKADGSRLWLTLDSTALLARGPVVAVKPGVVTLATYLTFANGAKNPDGTLRDHQDAFKGAWLGEGGAARMLAGAVRGERSTLHLMDRAPAEKLQADYGNRVVSVWQYGVGDRVEVARIDTDGSKK